jgi:pimeloyl-ACP methyl ester carboxylesterase
VLAACLRGQSSVFDLRRLPRVTAPTLVIVGEQDSLAGDPHPVAALFPRGTAATVPSVNHPSALADENFRKRAVAHLARDAATILTSGNST